MSEFQSCNTFWGSHGCVLEADHAEVDGDHIHVCANEDGEPCSENNGTHGRCWSPGDESEPGVWGEWMPWPVYH